MKNNQFRHNRLFRQFLEKQNNSSNNKTVYLKDVLIPLITAILAVGLNQFFFESNRITESNIEIHKESLKNQRPVLNRILAFTYKYDVTTMIYYTIPVHHYIYIDEKTH